MGLSIGASARPALAPGFDQVMALAHSHNDYDRKHPLENALRNGFTSVEADIWFRDGDLWISHTGFGWSWRGTLRELYLDPLQSLVDERGTVHGDGRHFFLWLDLKDGSAELRAELRKQLAAYRMLTTYDDRAQVTRPVTVILTGHHDSKRSFVKESVVRHASRDSNSFRPDDGDARMDWNWYSLRWDRFVTWDGTGEPSARVRNRLAALVGSVHSKVKRLRFYGVPETAAAWRLCVETGVDFISTDHPDVFRRFAMSYGHDPHKAYARH